MDASVATVVIMIFVLSIISGVTGSGPGVSPSNIVKPIPKHSETVSSPSEPVFSVSGAPPPHYDGGHKITIKEDITTFIQKKNKNVKKKKIVKQQKLVRIKIIKNKKIVRRNCARKKEELKR